MITTKFNNDYSIDNKDKEAIEHILSDYKRVLKENEKIKNENSKYMIEVEDGKFVDVKQIYKENETLKKLHI